VAIHPKDSSALFFCYRNSKPAHFMLAIPQLVIYAFIQFNLTKAPCMHMLSNKEWFGTESDLYQC